MTGYLSKTNDVLLQLQYKSNVDHCFCAKCGCRKRITKDRDCLKYSSNEKDILTYYFYASYTYEAITKFLSNYHDVSVSIRTLKRRFSEYGLKIKDRTLSNDVISQLIQSEIQGPHIMHGYREIWHLLKTSYNISVTRDSVMKLLKELIQRDRKCGAFSL